MTTNNIHATENIVDYINKYSHRFEWYNLASAPYAQCEVGITQIDRPDFPLCALIVLKSYDTYVAGIVLDHNYSYLFITGTYSQTTRKQLSQFAREFVPKYGYQGYKYIYEKEYGYKVDMDNETYLACLSQMQRYKEGNATWKNPCI